jgi:hypothetical protein
MRVEQDLRIAIKAAATASTKQERTKDEQQLITDWVKKFPAKAKRARLLKKKAEEADVAERTFRETMEKEFGLNGSNWIRNGEFSICNEERFAKAGGNIGTKRPSFSDNQVIAEYAAAKTKSEAEKVLAKYGIVWR